MTEKIAVLGAGSWGTALANVLTENGHDVRLWSHNPAQVTEINEKHTNTRYLKDAQLNANLVAYADMAAAVTGVEIVLSVVPTKAVREVASKLAQILVANDQKVIVAHATKGIEQKTYKRVSEMLSEEIPAANTIAIAVLSGPSHAEDVIKHDLTLVTVASASMPIAERIQKAFSNHNFRVYTNDDVIGTEMGSALKNIIAIGAGALVSLGYGDNAKAALLTRGLAEISRLGLAFGANPLTFIGLSGVGDLIVTGTSKNSRNWRAGYQLGLGKSLAEVEAEMGMVIEGVSTTKAAKELAAQRHVEMPITDAIYQVLYEGKDIKKAIKELMQREATSEID
ncbi:NAD(P)H-dependent glycerol-3-phosphate dehydrogenase [Periweissella ghanensis]|uniref:Glycerol-3-phosphate dehydrogenase [NAD(P)+] n=1 Tax=Periweissella ghanensis TaxID=467997 RepID=A0ABN8BNU8_9LACO|nr:NAD(P)H-dependent glycerol-3-phosphate dehydrogenase [Periweissella ghanensis]MCM0600504.1 NAD(P)H-dependent glycerol-3-phosphate dehydrogenase [Periweissella ghanensis]CAH0418286.1 Glycerol-3-phosphate dehydrogenase [NAD(P)+] [Periweissella ghanensis]